MVPEVTGGESRYACARDLVEAVVCLANGTGGVLLVGVEDDGTVSGARAIAGDGRPTCVPYHAMRCSLTRWAAVPWTGRGCVSGRPPGRILTLWNSSASGGKAGGGNGG
jgi:hypothetical protein